MRNNNILPFRPAATGLQEEQQQALFSDAEYIKDNPPVLTFPSWDSCEGIALALMLSGKEVKQKQFWEEFQSSRLSAYIWELRQLGFDGIVAERCAERDYRNWHKDEALINRAKEKAGISCEPPKGYIKRWNKYYLPKAFIDASPPEAFDWADETFVAWDGHCSGIDAWPDAET